MPSFRLSMISFWEACLTLMCRSPPLSGFSDIFTVPTPATIMVKHVDWLPPLYVSSTASMIIAFPISSLISMIDVTAAVLCLVRCQATAPWACPAEATCVVAYEDPAPSVGSGVRIERALCALCAQFTGGLKNHSLMSDEDSAVWMVHRS